MITERYHDLTENPDSCQGFQSMGSLTRPARAVEPASIYCQQARGPAPAVSRTCPCRHGGGGLAAASRQTSNATSRDFSQRARSPPPDHP